MTASLDVARQTEVAIHDHVTPVSLSAVDIKNYFLKFKDPSTIKTGKRALTEEERQHFDYIGSQQDFLFFIRADLAKSGCRCCLKQVKAFESHMCMLSPFTQTLVGKIYDKMVDDHCESIMQKIGLGDDGKAKEGNDVVPFQRKPSKLLG